MIGSLAAAVGLLCLLTIAPGPDMAVVMRAALSGGAGPARETAAGVVVGLLVWGLVAVAGLAALLATSAGLYAGVRLAGAVYLVWLGLRTLWRSRPSNADASGGSADPGGPAFEQHDRHPGGRRPGGAWANGLVTNLLNPKIGVFYTSVLPQLVPTGASVAAAQGGLGLAHAGLSLVWLTGWGRAVGRSRSLLRRPAVTRSLERVTGLVLVGFGLEVTARTG